MSQSEDGGSRLLRAIETIAISPVDAQEFADRYLEQSRERFPRDSEWDHQLRAADKIVSEYSKRAMMFGAATALPGTIPGLGTAVALMGGATADSLVSMKLQVDMCMCLAATFKYDIISEDGNISPSSSQRLEVYNVRESAPARSLALRPVFVCYVSILRVQRCRRSNRYLGELG